MKDLDSIRFGESAGTYRLSQIIEAAAAGRAFAAYGGVYILSSIVWMRTVEQVRPDRWDLTGAAICLAGVGVILLAPFLIWESVLRATLQIRVLLISNLCVSVAMVPILILATLRWGAIGTAGALAVNAVLMSAAGVVGLRRILKHLKESDLTGTCGHGPEVGAAVA